MAYVVGIDIGGTFTDAFAADEHGRIASAKTPSTPPDFSTGFLTVIDELAAAFEISTEQLLTETEYVVHGTTSTLNALVTGDVATVGLLTTRGHADSIAIMNLEGRYAGLGSAAVQDMTRTNKPKPLVPPKLIREIDERVDHKGRGDRPARPRRHPRRGRGGDRRLAALVVQDPHPCVKGTR